MADKDYDQMGRLWFQIQQNQHELEKLKNCGNEIANQLRVIADCLDLSRSEKILGVEGTNVFVSDHQDKTARLRGSVVMEGPGSKYPIPTNVQKVISRMIELKKQIAADTAELNAFTEP